MTKAKRTLAEHRPSVDHVRHDRSTCLAPGLFRSLPNGERPKLKVTYPYGEYQIDISGDEALGPDDLRILQGLVALAGLQNHLLLIEPTNEEDKHLRGLVAKAGGPADEELLVVKTSCRRLAIEINFSAIESGNTSANIRKSIERMWKVTTVMQAGSKRRPLGYKLIYMLETDSRSGGIIVAMSPRQTRSILGETQFTRICMHEVHSFKSDLTRLAHQHLCGWIDHGDKGKINIDTLCEYIWPGHRKDKPATRYKHRDRAHVVLEELRAIKWGVREIGDLIQIERPASLPASA